MEYGEWEKDATRGESRPGSVLSCFVISDGPCPPRFCDLGFEFDLAIEICHLTMHREVP